jgi:WD40 repeat protein
MDRVLNAQKLVGHFGEVNSIAAHEGIFATGANRHQGVEGSVRIWSFSSGDLVREIETDLNSIFGLAISPDGRFLVAGGGGGVSGQRWEYTGGIEVWNLEKKERVARFGQEELFFVKSIAFSPDGGTLLTSTVRKPSEKSTADHRRVEIWRTSDFKKISSFGEHDSDKEAACFSPEGRSVVFAANPASSGTRSPAGLLPGLRGQSFVSALLKNKRTVHFHDVNSMVPLIHIWNTVSQSEESVLGTTQRKSREACLFPRWAHTCILRKHSDDLGL